jgi:hypothetical protein
MLRYYYRKTDFVNKIKLLNKTFFLLIYNENQEKKSRELPGRATRTPWSDHTLNTTGLARCLSEIHINILISRVSVTKTRVCIGNWVYWVLTSCNYN